jgi:hypothetical protein
MVCSGRCGRGALAPNINRKRQKAESFVPSDLMPRWAGLNWNACSTLRQNCFFGGGPQTQIPPNWLGR